jgi:hypothetical protein
MNEFSEKCRNCEIANISSEDIWDAGAHLIKNDPVGTLKFIVDLQRKVDLFFGARHDPNDIERIKRLEAIVRELAASDLLTDFSGGHDDEYAEVDGALVWLAREIME